MAWQTMTLAVSGQPASSSANNAMVNNINDLNTRTQVIESWNAGSRLTSLESLTGASGATAAGNAALSSRLGTGVTTTSSATSQLTDLRSRVTAVESATGAFEPPYCIAIASTAQSFTSGVNAVVAFDTQIGARGMWLDNGLDVIVVGPDAAGLYIPSGGLTWANNGSGYRVVWWQVNGADVDAGEAQTPVGSTSHATSHARSIPLRLNAGDTVRLRAQQNGANPLSTIADPRLRAHMSLVWVAP